MKKFNLAALAVLDLLLLSSCSKESKGIVIEKTQNMLDDAPTAPEGYEYLEGWEAGSARRRNTKAHHTITF